jgi:hypothetical protein
MAQPKFSAVSLTLAAPYKDMSALMVLRHSSA